MVFADLIECYHVKVALVAHIRALEVLSDDLTERSGELARERHPSLEASIRFRRALDSSFRLFNLSTPEPLQLSDEAIKIRVTNKISLFLADISAILPRIDQAALTSTQYDWPAQFQRGTERIIALRAEIDQLVVELKSEDDAKVQILEDLNTKNRDLRKVL